MTKNQLKQIVRFEPIACHRCRYALGKRKKTTAILTQAAKTRAVVAVEHDMEFVRRLNCKVSVLHEGAVLAEGSLEHVTNNQDVIDVYLGR